MRILALSELPELWAEHVAEWQRLNAAPGPIGERPAEPERRARIHAVSGAHRRVAARRRSTRISSRGSRPTPSRRRAKASSRRAGSIRTRITNRACAILSARSSTAGGPGRFSIRLSALPAAQRCSGALNSLTQLVLKATMPGVPDFYQGTETWDLSLVDPDNRRPVDFASRAAALAANAECRLARAGVALDGRADQARAHAPAVVAAERNAGAVSRRRLRAGRGRRPRSRSHPGVPPFRGARSCGGRGRAAHGPDDRRRPSLARAGTGRRS